jgi:hypothetical protein
MSEDDRVLQAGCKVLEQGPGEAVVAGGRVAAVQHDHDVI